MADMTLAVVRPIIGWHALRDENYANPIVKGMARIERNEHRRDRILDDDELRAVWKTAEERNDAFGAYLRFLLLTTARRDEARELIRAEIKDGQWLLPAARNKDEARLAPAVEQCSASAGRVAAGDRRLPVRLHH